MIHSYTRRSFNWICDLVLLVWLKLSVHFELNLKIGIALLRFVTFGSIYFVHWITIFNIPRRKQIANIAVSYLDLHKRDVRETPIYFPLSAFSILFVNIFGLVESEVALRDFFSLSFELPPIKHISKTNVTLEVGRTILFGKLIWELYNVLLL